MHKAGKQCDEKVFAEQRTNILLRSGDHYNNTKTSSSLDPRSRRITNTSGSGQKIRLVKNHIHRITNLFINSILEANPSVSTVPYNNQELSDVKAAQLSQAVIDWVKDSNNWSKKQAKFVHDFIVVGECWGKIRFDYDKGPVIAQDEDGTPIKAGEFVIDRIFGFDLKRDPSARDSDECKWWIHEQMVDIEEFKNTVRSINPDELEKVSKSQMPSNYKIFDGNTGDYKDVSAQISVKEMYYKPDTLYPNGYYCLFTDDFIVTEGELPFGIFPLVGEGFDEMTTSPRATSIIKVCRPYQVEINRASSKVAEHQVTLGDDKVFIQKGTKLSSGGVLNGVRAMQFSGQPPIIQPGRTGTQFIEYLRSQVQEMYEAVGLADQMVDKQPQGDPYHLLYNSMKQKKKFVKYGEKYERFEISVFNKILEMAKHYLMPQHIIRTAGMTEAVNIDEFKNGNFEGFQVKVVPQSGDVETRFGQVLTMSHILQFAGSSLSPDQLGQVIRQMPFGNAEIAFDSLTLDTDNATNDILALDKGEFVPVRPSDNHTFMAKTLINRTKKSDFRFLSPQAQQAYMMKIQQHEVFIQQQALQVEQQKLGLIPSGGFLTTVNASFFNPQNNRVERIKVPSEAIQWLVDRLNTQGALANQLGQLPPDSQARVSEGQAPVEDQMPGISPSDIGLVSEGQGQ